MADDYSMHLGNWMRRDGRLARQPEPTGFAGRVPNCGHALIVAVAAALGCGSTQRSLVPSDIRPLPYALSRGDQYVPVRGLDSALANSPEAPVRVLVVHGMKARDAGYSRVLQRGVASRLGLQPQRSRREGNDSVARFVVTRGYSVSVSLGIQPLDTVTLRPSEIRRHAWTEPTTGRERLIFYELLWAPLRDDVKFRFFSCFESGASELRNCPLPEARRNTDRRAWVNRIIKDEVLVDGVADATIVLGPVGDVLRDDVTLSFCLIAVDVLKHHGLAKEPKPTDRCDLATAISPDSRQRANLMLQQSEFNVMTHSLGSFLVLDAHWRAMEMAARNRTAADPDAVARDVAAFFLLDDATVWMRANQIALLKLGQLRAICSSPCPNKALANEEDVWNEPDPSGMLTTYVAFNDANDLLGFELPSYLSKPGVITTFVNVTVRNPARWSIPKLFKNPGDAHTRSDENPAILDAMVRGFAIPKDSVSSRSQRR